MSLLKGEALLWWLNEETNFYVTHMQVTKEVLEETFRIQYLTYAYKHQQVGALQVVRCNGIIVEAYEAK